MMKSIIANINDDNSVLANALRPKRKEGLLSDIDDTLLKAVYEVLAIAEEVFDTLEFSSVPTIEYVLPSYYLLRDMWSETKPTDLAEVRRLKKELVDALDRNQHPLQQPLLARNRMQQLRVVGAGQGFQILSHKRFQDWTYSHDSVQEHKMTDILAVRVIKVLCRLCQRKKYHACLTKIYDDTKISEVLS
jgi:hypothetical protein